MVEVPWQVVPGPAAQSFCPFSATPKHFSFLAAVAASTSALVSGPADAKVAKAVETAPARTSELTTFFADMIHPLEVGFARQARRTISFVPLTCGVTPASSRNRETAF